MCLNKTAILTIPNTPFSEHHSVFFYTSHVNVWDGSRNTKYTYSQWEAHFANLVSHKKAELKITADFEGALE